MKTEEVIRAAVARCDRIVAGVAELDPILNGVLPFGGDDLAALTVAERIASVALLKRFEQLQDMLGRLFRAYLDWEAEDVRAMTRRDLANHLEKLQIVEDADDWIAASELRNRLVHEYPIEESEQVERVNSCWTERLRLIAMYRRLRERLVARELLK